MSNFIMHTTQPSNLMVVCLSHTVHQTTFNLVKVGIHNRLYAFVLQRYFTECQTVFQSHLKYLSNARLTVVAMV